MPVARSLYVPVAVSCLLTLGTASYAARALACSGFACSPGALLPKDSGSIPANAVELFWKAPRAFASPQTPDAGTAQVHLYKLENGTRSELAITLTREGDSDLMRVVPKRPVSAGSELSFESEWPLCNPMTERTSFTINVTAAAQQPLSAGQLRLVSSGPDNLRLPVSSGECTSAFYVRVAQLAFELSDEARPFRDVLRHSLIVDGVERPSFAPWPEYPAGLPMPELGGRLDDKVVSLCHTGREPSWRGDTPGMHTVQWLTRLQDGTQLRSNELTIDLTCPLAAGDAGIPDAAATEVADTSALTDGGMAMLAADATRETAQPTDDAGPARADVSVSTETVSEPGDALVRENDDGCALGGHARRAGLRSWPVALAIGLALQLARRRKQVKS